MTKEGFFSLITKFVLPLFTGAEIVGEEESSSRESEVAMGGNGTVVIKAHKTDEYRYIIKRNQPFKSNDVVLIKNIILELVAISDLGLQDPNYIQHLQGMAIEKSICQMISEKAPDTLLGLLGVVNQWSNRTYEGRRLSAGIILNETEHVENPMSNLHYSQIISKDFFALISDGYQSCIEFDANGFLKAHKYIDRPRSYPTHCPYEFINIAKYCDSTKIGISLLQSGEVLLFKNRELVFARRKGVWVSYCHDEIIGLLSNRTTHTMKEIRKAIYFTSLDVSFSYTGGCLVYLNKDKSESALHHIDIYDIISESHYNQKLDIVEQITTSNALPYEEFLQKESATKANALRKMINGRKFHELDRKLRSEMVAMDGATVVDYDGTIIATGAIIKIEAGSSGGGRLAATKTLAKYGVAIKISMDGGIQCFTFDKKQNKPKELFRVG